MGTMMRLRIVLPLLIALAALVAATPAPAAEIGLNVNGGAAALGDQQNFSDLSTLDAKWARHFAFIEEIEGDESLRPYVAMAAQEERLGINTLVAVMSNQGQAPSDPQAAADKLGRLAKVPGLDAIEVWNEADEGLFWSGGPNPAAYVDFLKRSHAAIKAQNPAVRVVFSPTVGNNFGFLEAAYREGAKGYFDAMAVHTDTACLDQAPGTYYREPDGRIGRFAFLGYREVYKVMQANGDGDKPIWMTEFGWSAATHTCEFGAGAGQKPAGVGDDLQAQYLLEAMNCIERDPFVTVAMWFNNRDLSRDGKMENMYGLRRADNSTRPSFDAFKSWTGGGGRSTAPCGDFEGPPVQAIEPKPGFVLLPGANLLMRAQSDAPDLNRIWFRVEGPGAQPLFADGPISLPGEGPVREREWGGARDLGTGQHRLVIWATDRNGNAGPEVVIPFAKGEAFTGTGPGTGPGAGPGTGPGTDTGAGAGSLIRFPKLKLGGRGLRRTFSGGALPGVTSGAVRVEWQLKQGRRWKRFHGKTVIARRPFRVKQKLRRPGQWRVRALYLGRPGIKRTASCWVLFHTRSTKTRLSCPRGAVRPSR